MLLTNLYHGRHVCLTADRLGQLSWLLTDPAPGKATATCGLSPAVPSYTHPNHNPATAAWLLVVHRLLAANAQLLAPLYRPSNVAWTWSHDAGPFISGHPQHLLLCRDSPAHAYSHTYSPEYCNMNSDGSSFLISLHVVMARPRLQPCSVSHSHTPTPYSAVHAHASSSRPQDDHTPHTLCTPTPHLCGVKKSKKIPSTPLC